MCSSEATAYTNQGCLEDFIRHHVCSPVLHWGLKLPSRINKVLYYLTPRCVMCDLVSDLKVFFLFPQGFLLQGCERQGDANLWRQRLGVQWMSSKTLLNRTQTVGTQHMVGGQVCPVRFHVGLSVWLLLGQMCCSRFYERLLIYVLIGEKLCFVPSLVNITLIMWALKDIQRSNFMALCPWIAMVNRLISQCYVPMKG